MTGEGGQAVNQRDARKLALLDRALTIAADMFAAEGYCSDYGDPNPAAIRNFLLRKAREELRELKKPEKQKDPRTL